MQIYADAQESPARRWLVALGLVAAGAIGIAAGRGKIRYTLFGAVS